MTQEKVGLSPPPIIKTIITYIIGKNKVQFEIF